MKTYRNEQLGFEINVPEQWSLPTGGALSTPFGESISFGCGPNEAFNFQIGLLIPETLLDETEREFKRYAQEKGYTELELGRVGVGGKDHVWARYGMGFGDRTKKYMIVFGETEYAITATCFDQKAFAEREKIWDAIIATFRLPPKTKTRSVGDVEGMFQAAQFFELGSSYFRSGRYQEALEQFERGKLLTRKYPWNFFGVCATTMQMIEIEAISEDQIALHLEKAEKNLDQCLRIAPTEQDYLAVKNKIRELREKHHSADHKVGCNTT